VRSERTHGNLFSPSISPFNSSVDVSFFSLVWRILFAQPFPTGPGYFSYLARAFSWPYGIRVTFFQFVLFLCPRQEVTPLRVSGALAVPLDARAMRGLPFSFVATWFGPNSNLLPSLEFLTT